MVQRRAARRQRSKASGVGIQRHRAEGARTGTGRDPAGDCERASRSRCHHHVLADRGRTGRRRRVPRARRGSEVRAEAAAARRDRDRRHLPDGCCRSDGGEPDRRSRSAAGADQPAESGVDGCDREPGTPARHGRRDPGEDGHAANQRLPARPLPPPARHRPGGRCTDRPCPARAISGSEGSRARRRLLRTVRSGRHDLLGRARQRPDACARQPGRRRHQAGVRSGAGLRHARPGDRRGSRHQAPDACRGPHHRSGRIDLGAGRTCRASADGAVRARAPQRGAAEAEHREVCRRPGASPAASSRP